MDLMPISQHTIVFSDAMLQVVNVTITPDMKLEVDESFFARLSVSASQTGVVLNPAEAQVTILDDEGKV